MLSFSCLVSLFAVLTCSTYGAFKPFKSNVWLSISFRSFIDGLQLLEPVPDRSIFIFLNVTGFDHLADLLLYSLEILHPFSPNAICSCHVDLGNHFLDHLHPSLALIGSVFLNTPFLDCLNYPDIIPEGILPSTT